MVPIATVVIYSIVFSGDLPRRPPDFGSGRPGNFVVVDGRPGSVDVLLIAINYRILTLLGAARCSRRSTFRHSPGPRGHPRRPRPDDVEFGILAALILLIIGRSHRPGCCSRVAVPPLRPVRQRDRDDARHPERLRKGHRPHHDGGPQLLFFLTPIIYPIAFVPEAWHGIPLRAIVQANPLAVFIESLRALVYGLKVPDPTYWAQMLLWSLVSVSVAAFVYQRRGQDIGESI
jgi:hypothetical protein